MKFRLLGALAAATVFMVSVTNAETNQPPQEFKYAATQLKEMKRAQEGMSTSPQNAGRKLGRGIANVLFGVVEVPNQITQTTYDRGGAAGTTFGLGKGVLRWIGRELTGVYEIVTFPIPFPRGYKPIMRPEWPNEDYEP